MTRSTRRRRSPLSAARRLEREPRLADAAGSGQRQQPARPRRRRAAIAASSRARPIVRFGGAGRARATWRRPARPARRAPGRARGWLGGGRWSSPAGLDPELLDEDLARVAVGLQRVGLAAAAIQREHQLRVQALAPRVHARELLKLRDQLGVAPVGQVGLDAQLQRGHALLLEPGDLGRRERQPARPRRAAVHARAPAPRAAPRLPPRARRRPAPRGRRRRAARSARRRARRDAPAAGSRPAWCTSTSGSPSAWRRRDTWTCTVLTALAGASSPHSASARRSALTGSLACNSSTANNARGLHRRAPPHDRRARTSIGPRIENSMAPSPDPTPPHARLRHGAASRCERTVGAL